MINFFDRRVLYFSTWPDSFGDGINNIKHMYYVMDRWAYKVLLHVNINSCTNRTVGWMLARDNMTDRIYIHPELNPHVDYLNLFNVRYDEVYFRDLPINNHEEVYKYFIDRAKNCYAIGPQNQNTLHAKFEAPLKDVETFRWFKNTFAAQMKRICDVVTLPKKAIFLPFSTRRYATLTPETIYSVCEMLHENGYAVLLCGEVESPYSPDPHNPYTSMVGQTVDYLNTHGSDNIVNLLGMGASKVAELSGQCDVILYASTGAIQMSYYDYAKCPWIILENGRENMMNGLSRIFSSTDVKIVDALCPMKYCLNELNTNPTCDPKIKQCEKYYAKCMGDEFNLAGLEHIIRDLP